jgi:hypothetical protein
MDDVTYHLRARYETISRSFRIKDGENAGDMLSGLYRRDMVGTYYDYEIQVEPDPQYPLDYDNFYQAISAPVNSHRITLPYGQSTITFDAMVTGGSDRYKGEVAKRKRWDGLQVQFTAIAPYREPET